MTTVKEPLANSVSPPPCSAPCSTDDPQDRAACEDSTNNFNRARCQFTYSDGRQCRHPAKVYPPRRNLYQQDELSPLKKVRNERAPLCAHHAAKPREPRTKDAPPRRNVYQQDELSPLKEVAVEAPELVALCGDLTTATNINRALAQVFLLMAQGRIPQKQAVAFGYLAQLLLQTVPGIRSEFVSAFGYRPWQENLTARLGSSGSAAKSQHPPGIAVPSDEPPSDERAREDRGTSPASSKTKTQSADPRQSPAPQSEAPPSAPEPALSGSAQSKASFPDYDSIYSRSLDLFAGKYNATPEGRREARALATELELMEPPASKPPKSARASVIEHMKRWIAQRKTPIRSGPTFRSPEKVDHPTRMVLPTEQRERATSPQAPSSSFPAAVPSGPPTQPANLPQPPVAGPVHSPAAPIQKPEAPDCALPAPAARQYAPPPGAGVPPARRSPAGPALGITLMREGHSQDWYAPASWSRNRAPNPFPSHREKLGSGLCGMGTSKLRHVQHLNSRRDCILHAKSGV